MLDTSPDLSQILKCYCGDPHRNGLLLLTLPTGFGKTYHVLNYIAEHLNSGRERRIWFVTNLKKNLPVAELRARLQEETTFGQSVLYLNSYSEHLSENWDDLKDIDIPQPLQESWRQLGNWVRSKREAKSEDRALARTLNERFREAERLFRKRLKEWLRQNHLAGIRGSDARLHQVRRKAPWVEQLYPSVAFHEKRVIFCSVRKFYYYLDTLIGPNQQISNTDLVKGDLLFIDEFDATKEDVKDAIVEEAAKFSRDLVGLFTSLYHGLQQRAFPGARLSGFPDDKLDLLRERYNTLLREYAEIYRRHRFDLHFYYQDDQSRERAFLFHDFQYHVITGLEEGSRRPYLIRRLQEGEQRNRILLSPEAPETDQQSFFQLLLDVRRFIGRLAVLLADMGKAYKVLHDAENAEEISLEDAVRTVLDMCDIRGEERASFYLDLIRHQFQLRQGVQERLPEVSPLDNGFRVYDLRNAKSHDATSQVYFYEVLSSPEAWMLQLCRKAMVVGLSATAGMDAPLSNYSLRYLKQRLGDDWYSLSSAENQALRTSFEAKYAHQDRRQLDYLRLANSDIPETALKEVVSNVGFVNDFLFKLQKLTSEKGNLPFEAGRYVKIAKVYQHLLQHPELRSCLCLSNKLLRSQPHDSFNRPLLEDLLTAVRQTVFPDEPDSRKQVETDLFIVRSRDFEGAMNRIRAHLQEGGRAFVLSTYATMGAGQNIQYPIPEGIHPVAISEEDYGLREKDFDALYLEAPTYLLHYFEPGKTIDDKQLLNYLFEVTYLAHGGAINQQKKRERLRYGFQKRWKPFPRKPGRKDLNGSPSVIRHYARQIIQAIGRLCRTPYKNPRMAIFYDERIEDYLQSFRSADQLFVPEFLGLVERCRKGDLGKDGQVREQLYRDQFNALETAERFRFMASRLRWGRQEDIDYWEWLREHVLRYPTCDQETLDRSGLHTMYVGAGEKKTIAQYWFEDKDDFRKRLRISHRKRVGQEVSSTASGLDGLMTIPELRKHFEESGFALDFQPNAFIMGPPLYRNIYLGALGEEAGRFILSHFLGQQVVPVLPEHYELFDGRIGDTIFIDFKHWNEMNRVPQSKQHEKILRKLEEVEGSLAMIINLAASEDYRPVVQDRIIEIPRLIDQNTWRIDREMLNEIANRINQVSL